MTDERSVDEMLDEVYGSADNLVAEMYGRPPFPASQESIWTAQVKPRAPKPEPRRSYEVTSHARLLCDCGVYVYTERINGGAPALPKVCWRCEQPLPKDEA